LEPDLALLQVITEELRAIYGKVEVLVIIGNTDPYYIYLQQFGGFNKSEQRKLWKQFIGRWGSYQENLQNWVKGRLRIKGLKVLSWYKLEKIIEKQSGKLFESQFNQSYTNLSKYFSISDLQWELRALSKQFGPDKYFEKLPKPSKQLLNDWTRRKFAEYTVQGLWIYQNFPNAVLIQNEKPSKLRSKMYQPLIKRTYKNRLPIVYFYGVDNTGYQ
jgi:hypothetical protein